jgi:F-type H+-transporting ATPase subunit delta
MLAQQVATKYSAALFNIVREKNLVDQAYEQFEQLDSLITSDKTLLQFLLAPHILEDKKAALVKDIFGPRLEPLFLEFLLVLLEKHRMGFLHEIVEEFRKLVEEARGIVKTRVITAQPLTGDEQTRLAERLQAKTGKTIKLVPKVEPSILGGMIVILKDRIIDGSVRHKLSILREELMKLKVA